MCDLPFEYELTYEYSVPTSHRTELLTIRKTYRLTLILLTWTKWWTPASASKWRMGFNSAFKVLMLC
jgi:hypothetical protein